MFEHLRALSARTDGWGQPCNLIDMMKTQGGDQYHLIIAAGDKLNSQLRREYNVGGASNATAPSTLPGNVQIFPWVSQIEVMQDASAVFMHGGLATIKESIYEGVPIVIVPHGKDQMDNALRIKRSGVGLVSEVDTLTPTALRKFLTDAMTNTWVKRKLAEMQAIFKTQEDEEDPKRSIQVITSVVAP